MNLVYARTFKLWVTGDKQRMEQPMDFLKDQFDAMLLVPVAGQVNKPGRADDDFMGDYRALMDKE